MVALRRPLVAGNWKMNGLRASIAEVRSVAAAVAGGAAGHAEVLVCPPFTLVAAFAAEPRAPVEVGGRTATPSRRAPTPVIFQRKC